MKLSNCLLLLVGLVPVINLSFAQTINAPLNLVEKKQVIDSVCGLLKTRYVIPETGSRLADYLIHKENAGFYDAITDPAAFADTLTQDLIYQSKDQHFQVYFDPAWVADSKAAVSPADSLTLRIKRAEKYRSVNYGFREINNLDGNIGYLKLTAFVDPIAAGSTVAASMNALSQSDALIIDIRGNPGGFKESVDLISSYLFDANHDFTLPYVPGRRITDIPVYLLIDRFTYSAAEGFSQLLKIHKRATLIGEHTGGAAHGIDRIGISARFFINMPVSKPTPDWEGIGIIPDINVASSQALNAAMVQALYDLSKVHPENSAGYQWLLEDERAKEKPLAVELIQLKMYTGDYGPRKLYIENGQLYYHREGDIPYALSPLTNTLFRFVDTDEIRIKFITAHGTVDKLQIMYKDGSSKTIDKTNNCSKAFPAGVE